MCFGLFIIKEVGNYSKWLMLSCKIVMNCEVSSFKYLPISLYVIYYLILLSCNCVKKKISNIVKLVIVSISIFNRACD